MKNIEISSEKSRSKDALQEKNKLIASKDAQIQKLQIDLNKEQRRVGPRIFTKPQGGGQHDSLMDKLQKGEIKENRPDETTRRYPIPTYLEVTYTEDGETYTNEICFRKYIKNQTTKDIYGIVGTSKNDGFKSMVENACREGNEWYYYFDNVPDRVQRRSKRVII